MSDNDPFLQVQSDVLSLLDTTRPLFSSYLRIRASASSPNSPELKEARSELESTLTDLSTDLQDLIDSVKAVEHDPYKYGLDVPEVARRRKLVEDVGREVEDMHTQLAQTVHAADAKKGAGSTAGLAHPDAFLADDDDNDGDGGYGQWEEQRQQEIMHEQDEALDGVFQTVGNLRLQADTMGRELEEQAEMLEEVDTVTDRVQGKLGQGMKKIGFVIRKNEDRWSSCCIAVLIFVLILLLILVLVL
ncbi:hypothetical protein MBLNU230_g4787t1 [Neophaeotheca triangularis]